MTKHLKPNALQNASGTDRALTRELERAGTKPSHITERPIGAPPPAGPRRDPRELGQIVLVLQGGGALGAYQVGAYQALHEAGVEPDWIIGTSIGAINASLIAGNAPEERLPRLREFWKRMNRGPIAEFVQAVPVMGPALANWLTIGQGIESFFTPNPLAFAGVHLPLGTEKAGFYSTAPLERTLSELVDFSRLAQQEPRLTVGAANVRT